MFEIGQLTGFIIYRFSRFLLNQKCNLQKLKIPIYTYISYSGLAFMHLSTRIYDMTKKVLSCFGKTLFFLFSY